MILTEFLSQFFGRIAFEHNESLRIVLTQIDVYVKQRSLTSPLVHPLLQGLVQTLSLRLIITIFLIIGVAIVV